MSWVYCGRRGSCPYVLRNTWWDSLAGGCATAWHWTTTIHYRHRWRLERHRKVSVGTKTLSLTEVFPWFFLSCKANARVKKFAKTGHGPHSSQLVVICVVLLLFVFSMLTCVVLCIVCVLMCTVLLPPGGNPIAVDKFIISGAKGSLTHATKIHIHRHKHLCPLIYIKNQRDATWQYVY